MSEEGTVVLAILGLIVVVVVPIFLIVRRFKVVNAVADEDAALAVARAVNQARLDAAWTNYRAALDALKLNPADAEMREKALGWGRHYASLTHTRAPGMGGTVYDEVSIANDITAATASGTVGGNVEERLARLDDLMARGVLKVDEYERQRAALVAQL